MRVNPLAGFGKQNNTANRSVYSVGYFQKHTAGFTIAFPDKLFYGFNQRFITGFIACTISPQFLLTAM